MSTYEEVMSSMKSRMEATINTLKNSLGGLRTGRASTSLLDPIRVEAYGSMQPLSQLGTLNAPEARLLTVQVWDQSIVKSVEKAIANSGLGLNPASEGNVIRIPLPELSEERRKELAKKTTEYSEQAKIALRNIRRDAIDQFKKMEKNKEISEDDLHAYMSDVQKYTDTMVENADQLAKKKAEEIMKV